MRHRHTAQLRWSDPGLLGHPEMLGARSLTMRQELRQGDSQGDSVVPRLDAICVAFDYDADTSRPFDDDERAYWSTYLEDAQ